MRKSLVDILACPECRLTFHLKAETRTSTGEIESGELQCSSGHSYPIRASIPRFVPQRTYAGSFGFQWKRFARTQLDEDLGIPLSETRFFTETRWPRSLGGQLILEAGSGAGRFTGQAASTAATIVSLDYSDAIDVARENNSARPNIHYLQADMRKPPLRDGVFDKAYCFGVLQHTPDPEGAFRALLPLLKNGAEIVFDVYRLSWRTLFAGRYYLRPVTARIPSPRLFPLVSAYVRVMYPLLGALHRVVGVRARFVSALLAVSDYRGVLELPARRLNEMALLDTFDALSPAHDHPQTLGSVRGWLRRAPLTACEVKPGYNGIEARGTVLRRV